MAESAALIVEMIDDLIVVTMSGTLFSQLIVRAKVWLRSPPCKMTACAHPPRGVCCVFVRIALAKRASSVESSDCASAEMNEGRALAVGHSRLKA